MKTTQYVPDPWYVEQSVRIDTADAESRRLRALRQRLFHPGYLYVVEFDSGVVKVGRAVNAESRMAAHAKTGPVRRSWTSEHHLECNATEQKLIAFCLQNGAPYAGREYFRDVDFTEVCTYAGMLAHDQKRRNYLNDLIAAADGDLSVTWQAAHDRLPGDTKGLPAATS